MTRAEQRAILRAIANWKPPVYALKVDDAPRLRSELRDDIAIALAPSLGLEQEDALTQMQALRMTS